MVDIVGVVIIGEEAAAAVKALHQHALAVQVGKAQGAVHLVTALGFGPALHRGEQGVGHLFIVDEIHLGEAHAVGVPLLVGLVAEDGADAAHHLAVAHGQPAAGFAILEGGVLFFVPVAHIIVEGGGDELGDILIENIGKIHELAQLTLRGDFNDRDHRGIPPCKHKFSVAQNPAKSNRKRVETRRGICYTYDLEYDHICRRESYGAFLVQYQGDGRGGI